MVIVSSERGGRGEGEGDGVKPYKYICSYFGDAWGCRSSDDFWKCREIPLIVFLYLIYLHSIWKCKTEKVKITWEAAVLFRALLIVLYIFCFAEKCFNCGGRDHIRADCSCGPSERAKGAQRGKWRGRGGRRTTGGRRKPNTGHEGGNTVTLQFF